MPEDVRIWEIQDGDNLTEISKTKLDKEERIEKWIERDISVLSNDLLVIGRQVGTDFGGAIDLLCLDRNGDAVIVELKRDKTPRDITAQILDYASWVKDLSNERISEIANQYLGANGPLEDAFKNKFGYELPEVLNESHKMMIVASEIDESSERIINYLSDTYGVGINAATFHFFIGANNFELLSRVFLIEPSKVEFKTQTRSTSKRQPPLSFEKHQEIADQRSVGDIYKTLKEGLEAHFDYTKPYRESVSFIGKIEGHIWTVFSISPLKSSSEEGLKYIVYLNRLLKFLSISEKEALSILPNDKTEFQYTEHEPEDSIGYEGFFKSIDEAERFVGRVSEFKKRSKSKV